jgi:SOS-response transcriptional repressor LexA
MIQPLTKRQREVLDFLGQYVKEHGFAPTLGEIAVAMNLSALATVHKHLEILKSKGYIRRQWNRSRYLELNVLAGCCPACGRPLEKIVNEAKAPLEIRRKSDTVGSVVDALTSATPTTTEVP